MSATASIPFKPAIPAESFFPSPVIHQEDVAYKFSLNGDKNDYQTIVDLVQTHFSSPDIKEYEMSFLYKTTNGLDRYDKEKRRYYLSQKSITDLTKVCTKNGLAVELKDEDNHKIVKIFIPAEDFDCKIEGVVLWGF